MVQWMCQLTMTSSQATSAAVQRWMDDPKKREKIKG